MLCRMMEIMENATGITSSETSDDPYPFEDFAPTLSQCFVIVIVGYLLARFEVLIASDVRGVVAFAGYFAMPGIICASLADASFGDFRWELLVAIFLGKLIIFAAVAGFLLRLHRNLGVAGLVATFIVQSNDLPVGNPLMSALYKDHRPQMMKYLFLIPAMTVICFVPVGNVMIDIHRRRRKTENQRGLPGDATSKTSPWRDVLRRENLHHVCGIARHPVVIATILGLILNVVSGGKLPNVVHQPIKVAAATIPGIALAMLGFSMVRRERHLLSSAVLPAAVLLLLKMVVTPVLMHTLTRMLTKHFKLLSDFALLYGIISPATVVFQLGPEFRKPIAVMSVALILSSFACFPVSYAVARFTIVPSTGLREHVPFMRLILLWTAGFSILCDVTTCIAIVWRKQWQKVPCCYIIYHALTQLLTSCGVLLWCLSGNEDWAVYSKVVLYFGGEISGYLWAAILALVLSYRMKYSTLDENGFSILLFTAFSLSTFLTMVICLLLPYNKDNRVYVVGMASSSFQYLQLAVVTVLLLVCLMVAAVCLLKYYQEDKCGGERMDPLAYENSAFCIEDQSLPPKATNKEKERPGESSEACLYYGEVVRGGCQDEWTGRLAGLVLLQVLVMVTRLIANVYKLSRSQQFEVIVPMEYLQSTLFVGQGFFLLITFGVDVRTVVISLRKWLRRKVYGEDEESTQKSPVVSEPSHFQDRTPDFCSQFRRHYLSLCFRDLAKDKRWKGSVYKDCFWGHQLVDWMISEGLCKEDVEAEGRGQELVDRGLIAPVAGRHCFRDATHLYHFVREVLEPK